jgi:uncharacterized sulfatase
MWKKLFVGLLALILGTIVLLYMNRAMLVAKLPTDVILKAVKRTHVEVAANRPVIWQQGPQISTESTLERPPNVVFIVLDDLGINDLSVFGGGVADGRVKTPNIDKLAADGALFSQAYAGNGTCAPSRAMLMTGRYPTRTGFEFTPTPPGMGRTVSTIGNRLERGALPPIDYNRDAAENATSFEDMGLPGAEVTIAEVLKTKGYHTVHIGKWHMGKNEESRPNAQGFDESLLMENMLYLPENDPGVVNAKLDFDPIDQFLWARGQFANSYNMQGLFEPDGYLTDYWTDESLKVIEANKNRPFFLYLAHWGVHTPLQATKEDYDAVGDIEPHHLRVYAAMLRALDRSVGRVVQKLEDEGLSEDTVIILTNDNGGAGYIGLPDVNAPYRGWKLTLFEGGIRVPMFIKWPGKIAPQTVVDAPVAHIDVMPTIAAAAGADLPQGVEIDGRSMLDAAMGTGTISHPNDALFWQSGYYRVVRAGDWKLQVDGRQAKSWLFNLASDPTEKENLAETRPDKMAELQGLLEAHQENAVPALYPYSLESAIAIDKTLADVPGDDDEYAWWPN